MSEIIRNNPITPTQTKKRPASNGASCLRWRNKWTHEIDCLKRDVEELKAQNEDLRAEMEERDQICKTAIKGIQSKDQIIASYKGKVKRCSHALEAMLKAGTSKHVLIDVV